MKGSSWSPFTSCLLSFDGLDEKLSFFSFVAGLQSDESGNDLLDPGRFSRWSPVSHRGQLKAFGAAQVLLPVLSFPFFRYRLFPYLMLWRLGVKTSPRSPTGFRLLAIFPRIQVHVPHLTEMSLRRLLILGTLINAVAQTKPVNWGQIGATSRHSCVWPFLVGFMRTSVVLKCTLTPGRRIKRVLS